MMDFLRLTLAAPLYYQEEAIQPHVENPGGPGHLPEIPEPGREFLFYYGINPLEADRIDPDPEQYLGPLLAAGTAETGQRAAPPGEDCLVLSPGPYYFTQFREEAGGTRPSPSGRGSFDFVETAMELQKEGLWERLRLGPGLYLRLLREDGAGVIQIWRPLG
jgi:hypothetical protein